MHTDGRSHAKEFGTAAPFRNIPCGRTLAEKSLPPAAAPGPGEIAVDVDGIGDGSMARFVKEVCRQHGFASALTTTCVERPGVWGFHLTNVLWHCYKASVNDTVLIFNNDTVLRAATMRGLELAGRDENAVVSMTKRIPTRSISERIQLASLRVRTMAGVNAFAGLHRAHLPYFANVHEEKIASIANGLDSCMVMAIRVNDRHNVMALPDIGESSLDLQNPDYPWRQFGGGIRHDTNGRRSSRVCGGRCASPLSWPPRRLHTGAGASRGGGRRRRRRHCRTSIWGCVRRRSGARSPSGLRSTSRHMPETLANDTAGRRGLTDKNNCVASAASPARSDAWGHRRNLVNVRRKGTKGRRRPRCAVNGARRRGS